MFPLGVPDSRTSKHVARLACAAAVLVGLAATPVARGDNPPAPEPTGPTPHSLVDGCQRDPAALLAGQTPEWAYVYNTAADQPPPPPRWVSGILSSQNPAFQAVHTSGADFAFGHNSYDFNMNILTDPEYDYLKAGHPASGLNTATGNYPGNGEETNRLHTENEDLNVPQFAWPEPGDRVTEKGSWVWDCGHWGTPTNIFSPDYDLPHEGQPCPSPFAADPSQCTITGERTEFHPYRALFDQRQQSPSSPYAENQAELFVSTDKTKAGVTEDCAHKFPPPLSVVLPNPASYPPAFAACMETEPNWQDVTGDYSFLVAAPPKPTPDARLTFRAVDHGSVAAPAPTLAQEGDAVRVTFHLDSASNQRVVEAYTIFAGWDTVTASTVPTHLHITFDRLDVHRAMDPGCSLNNPVPGCQNQSTRTNQGTTAPGDWNIYWDVNGIWGTWPPGELLVNDGDSLPGTQAVDLYVPPGKGWRLFVHGRECDINGVDPARPLQDCPTNDELADDNDVPGLILDSYSSADASLGTHTSNGLTHQADPTSTCPDNVSGQNPNPNGCYSVTYTVTKIDDAASRLRLPDLKVTKSDSPDPVYAGSQLTYNVDVKNNGPATAGGVTLADALPAGVGFSSATPSQGTCGQSTGTVTCQLGTLASGDSASVAIKVIPGAAAIGVITNTASVTANEDDANVADNIAHETTTVLARYIRPKAASPFRASLVPAYRPCTNPNETHGPPLSFPSCAPPAQESSAVTVGTFDANGKPTNSVGFERLDVVPGDPATQANEADVRDAISITDVRKRSNLSDYTGQMQAISSVQITDRANSSSGDTGTVVDIPFPTTFGCAATADTGIGATCSISTSFNAITPGVVIEGERAVWQLGQTRVFDGGQDGSISTPDNPLFAVQGIFVP
jgi:uncharacterized repeat protein (TIGR01451 family)